MDFLQQYVNGKGLIVDESIMYYGSGLNYNRKNWNQLLGEVMENKVKLNFCITSTYKKGQFYVRSGDFDRFLRGQSDTARIIRVAQCEEIGLYREVQKWIECDNMGEVGVFYEVKEEGV